MKFNLTRELSTEIKKYQKLYLVTKAEYETIKEISEENKIKVLSENIFTDAEGNRVLKYDYLIEDEKQFDEFMKLCYKENKKSGLPVTEYDKVVEYPKYQELREIEKKLLQLQLKTLPEGLKEGIKKAHDNYKYREEALDLILRLAV